MMHFALLLLTIWRTHLPKFQVCFRLSVLSIYSKRVLLASFKLFGGLQSKKLSVEILIAPGQVNSRRWLWTQRIGGKPSMCQFWYVCKSFSLPYLLDMWSTIPAQLFTVKKLWREPTKFWALMPVSLSNENKKHECTVECFARFLFRCENIGRQDDFANFWHFLQWI